MKTRNGKRGSMWKKLPSDHPAVYQDQSWPASMDSPAVVATGIATRRIQDSHDWIAMEGVFRNVRTRLP